MCKQDHDPFRATRVPVKLVVVMTGDFQPNASPPPHQDTDMGGHFVMVSSTVFGG